MIIGVRVRRIGLLLTAVVLCGSGPGRDVAIAAEKNRFDDAVRVPIRNVKPSQQNPCFSPDGGRLVITQWKRRYNAGKASMQLIDLASGARIRRLGRKGGTSVNLPGSCWNGPTNRIAYAAEIEGPDAPYVIAPDGTGEQLVIQREGTIGIEPSISPDGGWIVFQSGPFDAVGTNQIFKARSDGTGLTQLTSGHNDTQPNWSPAGDRIAFQRQEGGTLDEERPWDVFTMDVDGGSVRNVTNTGDLSETDVSWSPSGRFIVFSSDGPEIQIASLFAIAEDGTRRTQVTRTRGWYDGAPSWSPDGRRIAFEARRGDPDGSSGTRIYLVSAPEGMQ